VIKHEGDYYINPHQLKKSYQQISGEAEGRRLVIAFATLYIRHQVISEQSVSRRRSIRGPTRNIIQFARSLLLSAGVDKENSQNGMGGQQIAMQSRCGK
jgi:hypothetical protein